MNNDLISREALKKDIEQWFVKVRYYQPHSKSDKMPKSEVFDIIDNAPTVPLPDFKEIIDGKTNFSRPQGDWIATQVIGISEITLTCSNCKDEFIGENDIDIWKSVYHYCPSCGAYMGEE